MHSNKYLLNVEEFEKLYKRYYLNLLNFATQLCSDRKLSEDIVHEVFMKVWEKRTELSDEAIDSLLFLMTRNFCLNHLKHLSIVQNKKIDLVRIKQWEELYRLEYTRDEPYELIEKELESQVKEVTNNLPDKCREVFLLSRKDGLKNAEIAAKLDISIKAVEKHISRAIKEFRKIFLVFISMFF